MANATEPEPVGGVVAVADGVQEMVNGHDHPAHGQSNGTHRNGTEQIQGPLQLVGEELDSITP